MRYRADVFDRVRGIFETDVLAGKPVAVLGLDNDLEVDTSPFNG